MGLLFDGIVYNHHRPEASVPSMASWTLHHACAPHSTQEVYVDLDMEDRPGTTFNAFCTFSPSDPAFLAAEGTLQVRDDQCSSHQKFNLHNVVIESDVLIY